MLLPLQGVIFPDHFPIHLMFAGRSEKSPEPFSLPLFYLHYLSGVARRI